MPHVVCGWGKWASGGPETHILLEGRSTSIESAQWYRQSLEGKQFTFILIPRLSGTSLGACAVIVHKFRSIFLLFLNIFWTFPLPAHTHLQLHDSHITTRTPRQGLGGYSGRLGDTRWVSTRVSTIYSISASRQTASQNST